MIKSNERIECKDQIDGYILYSSLTPISIITCLTTTQYGT